MTDLDRLAALLAATAEGDSLGPVYRAQAARLLAAGVRLPSEDSIDAAWAEAESVLPPGWPLALKRWMTGPYVAVAGRAWPDYRGGRLAESPAAALRALTAQLRERGA